MVASHSELQKRALAVLRSNDLGGWTRPAPGLYPHQWLWDSCFVAIGLAHSSPDRAAKEIRSLIRGQWKNGMMPHMIYSRKLPFSLESILWGTKMLAPRRAKTSGISQPPVLAIAVEKVARSFEDPREGRNFAADMLPKLVRFHEWIYRERDPHESGLAAVIHSWESGMDDTPYWTDAMDHLIEQPWKWRWLREYRPVLSQERANPKDIQHMVALAFMIRANKYDSKRILEKSPVIIQDMVFNSVLAAANESLERLAEYVDQPLPEDLQKRFPRTRRALEELWDHQSEQYYSRDFRSNRLLRVPTIATFMPLFAGTASPSRAERLRELIVDYRGYNVPFPLPSVPTTSHNFDANRYWRGPVWVNMNWFIIKGLERYGFTEEAEWLRIHTLALVEQSGFREYYNPMTADGLGATQFSWTAALTLDLLTDLQTQTAVSD
jgi:glycogen debranching enzyme